MGKAALFNAKHSHVQSKSNAEKKLVVQHAPLPLITANGVRKSIFKSSQGDHAMA